MTVRSIITALLLTLLFSMQGAMAWHSTVHGFQPTEHVHLDAEPEGHNEDCGLCLLDHILASGFLLPVLLALLLAGLVRAPLLLPVLKRVVAKARRATPYSAQAPPALLS